MNHDGIHNQYNSVLVIIIVACLISGFIGYTAKTNWINQLNKPLEQRINNIIFTNNKTEKNINTSYPTPIILKRAT